jgi:general secretion pathway protein K
MRRKSSLAVLNERGLALIMVLWGLALLSLVAIATLSLERSARRAALDVGERAEAQALAEAGINRAILSLLDPDPAKRWRVDAVPYDFEFESHSIRVWIQDEAGKIDLNTADRDLLVSLFISAGFDGQASDELVDKILDWRDPSDLHRLNGAKDEDYRAAGYPYGPRNGPFQSVDELKLVMGMTPDLFERVRPALTIYSQRSSINPWTAPREALLALPGAYQDQVEAILSARTGGADDVPGANADRGSNLNQPESLQGLAFSIRLEITDPRSSSADVWTEVVRITGDPRRPYWVLSWENS